MIEILETKTVEFEGVIARHCEIIITDNGNSYLWNVGGLPAEGDLQAILEAREAELLQAASNTGQVNVPEIEERRDFSNLEQDITNQINWINDTIPEIDNGLAAVGAFTNATQRAIITGLLQNQKRTVLILRGVLRAFRYVIRKLG